METAVDIMPLLFRKMRERRVALSLFLSGGREAVQVDRGLKSTFVPDKLKDRGTESLLLKDDPNSNIFTETGDLVPISSGP